jgi:hypothetical protein
MTSMGTIESLAEHGCRTDRELALHRATRDSTLSHFKRLRANFKTRVSIRALCLTEGKHACKLLPISAFYSLRHQCFLTPEEAAYCEERTQTSYCVRWWNSTLNKNWTKKRPFSRGAFLHSKAEEVFGTSELKTWSRSSVRRWIDNYETRGRFERAPMDRSKYDILLVKLNKALHEGNVALNEYDNLLASRHGA